MNPLAARSRNDDRQSGAAGCRLGERENFSIIATTVIKPNKREITASTRGRAPARGPIIRKVGKVRGASGFNGFRKSDGAFERVEGRSPTSTIPRGIWSFVPLVFLGTVLHRVPRLQPRSSLKLISFDLCKR